MFKPLLTALERSARRSAPVPPLSMPKCVTVRGEERPLRVRVHANAKRMILRFDPRTGEGKMTVPRGTPASAALTFLSQSARWIDGHAPDYAAPGAVHIPQTLMLGGIPHRIVPTGRTRGTVIQDAGQEAAEHVLRVPGAPHRIMPRLAAFLKTRAENQLTPLAMDLASHIGKKPSAVRLRDPRSQWGSCSSSRVITLSWRVVMAPPEAQTYLVAHEVAHLAHMNHAPAFWQTVGQLDSNWKAGQRALKRVEKELLSIRFS